MANFCENEIYIYATDSEKWEINTLFDNGQIDWPISEEDEVCFGDDIRCITKWEPTPWIEGNMEELSKLYPSVIFHYVTDIEGEDESPSAWFCNGIESNKKNAEKNRRQVYKTEIKRFVSATPSAADGIKHRAEIMPDGRVAVDGENRFGECNIFDWKNIIQISCGNWHTVGLKKDGTVIACGSNANGQCDVSDIQGHAVAISCGRYHTAVLLENGRVIVKGKIEQEAPLSCAMESSSPLSADSFPLVEDVKLNKYIDGWEKMNERIEHISVGDELTLKKVSEDGEISFEVLNMHGEKVGHLCFDWPQSNLAKGLAAILNKIRVTVATVTPLSQKRKDSKYAAMSIRLEYMDGRNKTPEKPFVEIGNYKQTKVTSWRSVTRIKSIFDAVVGITSDGELLVDGFCPCSQAILMKIMGLNK